MSYARNTWYVGAWTDQVEGSKPLGIRVLNDRIVLYRTETGKLVALEDRCIHRLAPLSLGRCEGEKLRCMYHGILFDTDGSVAHIPGQDLIPAQARVRSYPVVERHSWVWVWMGDPAKADASLIPDVIGPENPDYHMGTGFLDYEAEASLISDNLLDFSHIAYVHENSFALGESMAETHAKILTLDNGIRYIRWNENLGMDAAGMPAEPLDSLLTYDYLIPGILILRVASFPLGSAKKFEYDMPDMTQAVRDVAPSCQAVTPLGPGKARYFFSYGIHRDFGTPEMVEPMMALTGKAFAEDKIMIEAQQQVINDTPEPRMIPTSHDRTVTIFNRMIEKMVRAESESDASAAA